MAVVEHAGRAFCLEALEEALNVGTPEIFNTDQGVQYTAEAFTGRLETAGVRVSMDGRGRWMDNVFVERLWRTVKYEHVYLHDHATPRALQAGLAGLFLFYNEERIHSALDYLTPGGGVCGRSEAAYDGIVSVVQINTKSRKKCGKPTCTHTGDSSSAAVRDLWNRSRGPLIPTI